MLGNVCKDEAGVDVDRGEISDSLYCMVHMFWMTDIIIDVIFSSCALSCSLILSSISALSCLLFLSRSPPLAGGGPSTCAAGRDASLYNACPCSILGNHHCC